MNGELFLGEGGRTASRTRLPICHAGFSSNSRQEIRLLIGRGRDSLPRTLTDLPRGVQFEFSRSAPDRSPGRQVVGLNWPQTTWFLGATGPPGAACSRGASGSQQPSSSQSSSKSRPNPRSTPIHPGGRVGNFLINFLTTEIYSGCKNFH